MLICRKWHARFVARARSGGWQMRVQLKRGRGFNWPPPARSWVSCFNRGVRGSGGCREYVAVHFQWRIENIFSIRHWKWTATYSRQPPEPRTPRLKHETHERAGGGQLNPRPLFNWTRICHPPLRARATNLACHFRQININIAGKSSADSP